MPVPSSSNITDSARLAALERYDVLDTPPEPAFDDIVELARQFCGMPIALVSLVTESRQWFKAKNGLDLCETPLTQSVCAHVVAEGTMQVIPDLAQDVRTQDNPLVSGEPHLGFYAGAPLISSDGFVLGSLCVVDVVPHPEGLSVAQRGALASLARQVVSQLELRRGTEELAREHALAVASLKRRAALIQLGDTLRTAPSVAEATQTAAQMLGQTLRVSRSGYARIDLRGDSLLIENDWTLPGLASLVGQHPLASTKASIEMLKRGEMLVAADIVTSAGLAADAPAFEAIGTRGIITIPLLQEGNLVGALYAHSTAPKEWTSDDIAFARAVADRLYSFISRCEAEEHQRILSDELSHRMKNTIAMVQAIAAQTLRHVSERDAVETFNRRILALSKAHDVLLQEDWARARIMQTIDGVLSLHGDREKFTLRGPDVNLGAKATLSLSLLVHELATNAIKHGALSVPAGRVAINWSLDYGAAPTFTLHWRERGGPATIEPKRQGFGSRLIKMGMAGTGDTELRFALGGLEATFRAPLSVMVGN
jgi:two-component sensor histidine kinase